MSTSANSPLTSGSPFPIARDMRVAVVRTLWNSHITEALASGAASLLTSEGVSFDTFHVPGAVELTYGAASLMDSYDAVIVFGCVIRGGTPHFDYVCQSVTQGITALNAQGRCPVIFGVLTVDTEQDAIDRAGGILGNKGSEAAEAAIKMIDFTCTVKKI